MPQVRTISPDAIFEACIFEIVTTEVEQVPVPDWAFTALGLPVEKRNFRYEAMLYPLPQRNRSWSTGSSVPDVSQAETQLWFYFLAKSYIDLGFEGIHWGQMEIMNYNDPGLDHYARVFDLVRSYAARHARRGMVLCNAHTPSGGLVRNGELLLDFHALPLRIKEVPDKAQEAILQVGYVDSIYLHSKGGRTYSGWTCEHLPYLVEFDNWGVSQVSGATATDCWTSSTRRLLGLGIRRDLLVRQPESRLPCAMAALCLELGQENGSERLPGNAGRADGSLAAQPSDLVRSQRPQPGGSGRPG